MVGASLANNGLRICGKTALESYVHGKSGPSKGRVLDLRIIDISAHALRVGFITEAYANGVRDEDIMRHTRHRDLRTMRGYVRRAGLISDSPARRLGL